MLFTIPCIFAKEFRFRQTVGVDRNKGQTLAIQVLCQEDRVQTSNKVEIICHDPLAMERETGETLFLACMGRAQGAPLHEMFAGLLRGNIKVGALLNIADLGGPKLYFWRLLRGFAKALGHSL